MELGSGEPGRRVCKWGQRARQTSQGARTRGARETVGGARIKGRRHMCQGAGTRGFPKTAETARIKNRRQTVRALVPGYTVPGVPYTHTSVERH